MKCMFQVIDQATGVRSPAGVFDRAVFAGVLVRLKQEAGVKDDDFVLVLLDDCGEQFAVSSAPLMRVGWFIQQFGVSDEQAVLRAAPEGADSLLDGAVGGDPAVAV